MKINRFNFENIRISKNNIKNAARPIEVLKSGDSQSVPAYFYKQFALNFCGNDEKFEEKEISTTSFDREKIETFVRQLSSLSEEEQAQKINSFVNTVLNSLVATTVKQRDEIKVPEGLSMMEDELFRSVAQLVNLRKNSVRNPDDVTIFSNAFSTLNIESDICCIPLSAPIFKNDEFLNMFQTLNVIENNEIGKTIKFAFENDNKSIQKKLFKKSTLGKVPIQEGKHSAIYEGVLERVYVEEDKNGNNLTHITYTYQHPIFSMEIISVAYEFNDKGQLSKIIKYDSSSTPTCVLFLDNENKAVMIQDGNKEARYINFKDGNFLEV